MLMPEGITDLKLARRLTRDQPDLKAIYTSGDSREIADSNTAFPFAHHFLPKPYQAAVLLHTVRDYLDQPSAKL